MFFFFLIGIFVGIYMDQEFQALPQLKPLVMATLQKLQQGAGPTHTESEPPHTESDNAEKEH